jgi:peptidyl-prolyl cis-trans isomerase-like 4
VEKEFIAQCGDPTNTGQGGESIFGLQGGARFFEDEIHDHVRHKNIGTLAMVNKGPDTNGSQFYVTLRGDLDFLDGKYTIFGEIAEGEDVLERINAAYCDKQHRPYRNIRIKHTIVLDDPFEEGDDAARQEECVSPAPLRDDRPEADDELVEEDEMTQAEAERATRASEAKSRAVVLEMVGDIPDAEMKPPENVLFVAKLNPLTQDADLDIIFGRFGPCTSNVIRDRKTGDSLNYAFIEFETQEAAEVAYEKMDNVIIDDRRIKVDFSQSAHQQWRTFNLHRREKQINKRREMATDMKRNGVLSGPSSQVVGGNDYQREVTNKWAGNPGQQGGRDFSAAAESKLGGFRDRKEGVGRGGGRGGGRYDVEGSNRPGPGPGGRGMGALEPAWKKQQRIKEEEEEEREVQGREGGSVRGERERHRGGEQQGCHDGRERDRRRRSGSRERAREGETHRKDASHERAAAVRASESSRRDRTGDRRRSRSRSRSRDRHRDRPNDGRVGREGREGCGGRDDGAPRARAKRSCSRSRSRTRRSRSRERSSERDRHRRRRD